MWGGGGGGGGGGGLGRGRGGGHCIFFIFFPQKTSSLYAPLVPLRRSFRAHLAYLGVALWRAPIGRSRRGVTWR